MMRSGDLKEWEAAPFWRRIFLRSPLWRRSNVFAHVGGIFVEWEYTNNPQDELHAGTQS